MKRLLLTILLGCSFLFASAQKDTPFNIHKRPLPSGAAFEKILPLKVGSFTRETFKEPAPGLDGEALYKNGKAEVFMLFSLSTSKEDQRGTMETIFTETKTNAVGELRQISLKSAPAYIHLVGKGIAFLAWTRGLYCFSVDSKGGDIKTLTAFMDKFPF